MALNIQLQPCHIAKAGDAFKILATILETRPVTFTTKMAINHCQRILCGEEIPDPDQKLAALEFLGAARELFDLRVSFKYSNPCHTIFWRLHDNEPFNTQTLSAKLWDQSVDRDRAAYIFRITCHLDNHTHNNHETPVEHAEGIYHEGQYSVQRFRIKEGPRQVIKWIQNTIKVDNEIETNTEVEIESGYKTDDISGTAHDDSDFDTATNASDEYTTDALTTEDELDSINDEFRKVVPVTNTSANDEPKKQVSVTNTAALTPHLYKTNQPTLNPAFAFRSTFEPKQTLVEFRAKWAAKATPLPKSATRIREWTTGFYFANPNEPAYPGSKTWNSPHPSELPIPSFYRNKTPRNQRPQRTLLPSMD
jgi:hypothetical protein